MADIKSHRLFNPAPAGGPAALRTVFLDRDGILNRKLPEGEYVSAWEHFYLLPALQNRSGNSSGQACASSSSPINAASRLAYIALNMWIASMPNCKKSSRPMSHAQQQKRTEHAAVSVR